MCVCVCMYVWVGAYECVCAFWYCVYELESLKGIYKVL